MSESSTDTKQHIAVMHAHAHIGSTAVKESAKLRWNLTNIAERRVLSAGISRLHEELVTKCKHEINLMDLPKRANGSSFVMQASFFKRLLREEVEIKSCMDSDISAAHLDLRHLTIEQLLTIRIRNVDFLTLSETHSAHSNFLDALDTHLSEKLTRQLLRGMTSPPAKAGPLRTLGRRLVLTLGAAEMLTRGWAAPLDHSCCSNLVDAPEIPRHWAIELDTKEWPGHQIALFHVDELRLEFPGSESCPDFSWPTIDGLVAIVSDISSGFAISRRFHWEIHAFDPATTDIPSAMASIRSVPPQQLAKELTTAMQKRYAVTNVPRPLVKSINGPSPSCMAAAVVISQNPGNPTNFSQEVGDSKPPTNGAWSRCPRTSIAHLNGKVANAIRRMEANTTTAAASRPV